MESKSSGDARNSANRGNAKKSTGPNNTTSSRFNAAKHGLLSAGITELDDADGYREMVRRLRDAYLDALEAFFLERIALYMTRSRRGSRLEAEFITGVLNPPIHGKGIVDLSEFTGPVLDPGLPVSIRSECVEALVDTYQRYETANENKLYRAIHELERMRRIRQGEHLPAPAALDVGVHSEHPAIADNGAVPEITLETSRFESAYSVLANDTAEQHFPKASELTKATEEPE
ncbi:MAG: hypothetical protein WA628_06225 [Terriglobales bacterium]